MMMPERMSRISVLVPRKDLDLAVQGLLDTGSFQPLSRPGEGKAAERARLLLPSVGEAISKIEAYDKFARARLDTESASHGEEGLEGVGWIELGEALLERFKELDAVLENLSEMSREAAGIVERISLLESLLRVVGPFRDVEGDLSGLVKGSVLRIYAAEAPRERIPRILGALEKRAGPVYALVGDIDEESSALLVVASGGREAVAEIFRSERAKQIEIPDTASKGLKSLYQDLSQELEELRRRLEHIREEARKIFISSRRDIIRIYLGLKSVREALQLISRVRDRGRLAVIEGYVPSSSLNKVMDSLKSLLGDRAIVEAKEIGRLESFPEESPPSKYSIPRRLETFKMVSELYGPPSYKEIVPVYITAITFPTIFGLMFPDLGHGLVLLIAGLVFYRILGRGSRSYRELGEFVIYIATASMIAGILSGEFFGPATPVSKYLEKAWEGLWATVGIEHGRPPLSIPIASEGAEKTAGEALMFLILLSLRIGGLTLTLSSLLNAVNSVLERDWVKIAAHDLPRLLMFLSISSPPFLYSDISLVGASYYYMASLPGASSPPFSEIFRAALYTSLLWIFLGEVILKMHEEGSGGGLKSLSSALVELFDNALILIGNTISYLRIMGIALAHIAIVLAFYQPVKHLIDMGGIAAAPAWILYAVGNLLDIGLESIVAFAHTLRLHLYEMFSKFYMGSGRPYEPLGPPLIRIAIKKRG